MELQGNRSNWQNGNYFESWLNYVSTCPACGDEIFNKNNKYRDVSKVVQCSCGARIKYKNALQNSKITHLINKHSFEIIKKEKGTMANEKSRKQILTSENKELKLSLEANRIKLRDVANTTVDGRPGDNSDCERIEKELADKLLANNLKLNDIDLAVVKSKFSKKRDRLDTKKTKLQTKIDDAQKIYDDFTKKDGEYVELENSREAEINIVMLERSKLQNADAWNQLISQNWATPDWLFDELDKEFNFDLDVAPRNSKIDFLLYPWSESNFCNPPYKTEIKTAFVKKAIQEQKKGNKTVFILPVHTGSRLWHNLIVPYSKDIRFLKGRIKFEQFDHYGDTVKNGACELGAPFNTMIVIF